MDAERPDDALNASALDRAIRAKLAVDPSPEFLARIRTRIASEPARATRWSWMFAAAGAMAALIAIAIVVSRDARTSHPQGPAFQPDVAQAFPPPLAREHGELRRGAPERVTREGGRPADSAAMQAPPLPRVPVVSASSRTMARSAKAFALLTREPEVLLDPAETRALRRLIAGTRDGTLDLSASLQATTPSAMDLPPVSEIAIPFITIDPITPQAGEEGAHQ